MKLVNLNISIKLANSNEVVAFLRSENADIVTLQEVVQAKEPGVHESFKSKEAIDTALGELYPHRYFAPLWSSRGQNTRDFGGLVEQGNYVLSKYPLTHTANLFFHREYEHIEDWSTWRTTDHARALQVVEIDAGKPLRILNIHGIWTADKKGDERTEKECAFVADVVRHSTVPTILVGDLNLLPESLSLQVLNKTLQNLNATFSITTTRPAFKDALEEGNTMVDYAFVNSGITVHNFHTVATTISDHLPLVLEFE